MRKADGPTDTIRGTPVYSLGETVLAFPDPQVIVNGPTELVGKILRGSHGVGEPFSGLLNDADWNATCVLASAGLPPSLLATFLPEGSQFADDVVGTTASCHYGPTVKFTRTISFRNPARVAEFQAALQRALQEAARDAANSEECPAAACRCPAYRVGSQASHRSVAGSRRRRCGSS